MVIAQHITTKDSSEVTIYGYAGVSCAFDTTEIDENTFLWSQTDAGSMATLPCPPPDNSSSAATRLCDSVGVWLPANISACGHLDTVQDINNLFLSVRVE